MSTESAFRTRIDGLLSDIQVLEAEYRDYAVPTAAQILARARAAREERATARTSHPEPGALSGRSEPEQARHELNLAVTLVLHQWLAREHLATLAFQPYRDPVSALLLACLLQLSGRHLAARFWFKFAAGGGNPEAAYCLCLAHRAAAEFQDADHWRRQAARLRRESVPVQVQEQRPEAGPPPLLARELRDLIAQCYRGGGLRLSISLEAGINRMGLPDEDAFPESAPCSLGDLLEALVPRCEGAARPVS